MKFERARVTPLMDLILSRWKEWKIDCPCQKLCSEFSDIFTKSAIGNEIKFPYSNTPPSPDTQQMPEFSDHSSPLVRNLQRYAAPKAPAIIHYDCIAHLPFLAIPASFSPSIYPTPPGTEPLFTTFAFEVRLLQRPCSLPPDLFIIARLNPRRGTLRRCS